MHTCLVDDSRGVTVVAGGLSEHVVKARAVRILLRSRVPVVNQLDRLLS